MFIDVDLEFWRQVIGISRIKERMGLRANTMYRAGDSEVADF